MRPRFSLRQLLVLVVLVAIGCGAFVAPSVWIASIVSTLVAGTLGFAVLAAVGKTGRARFFWIGFAVAGWGYLWLALSGFIWPCDTDNPLATNQFMRLMWIARYPDSALLEERMGGMGGGMFTVPPESQDASTFAGTFVPDVVRVPQGRSWPSYEEERVALTAFCQTGHALFALFFAYLGGCLTRAFFDRRSGNSVVS